MKGNGLGVEVARHATLDDHAEIRRQNRIAAREADSDDGANGYESTSSDEAEVLMSNLDKQF